MTVIINHRQTLDTVIMEAKLIMTTMHTKKPKTHIKIHKVQTRIPMTHTKIPITHTKILIIQAITKILNRTIIIPRGIKIEAGWITLTPTHTITISSITCQNLPHPRQRPRQPQLQQQQQPLNLHSLPKIYSPTIITEILMGTLTTMMHFLGTTISPAKTTCVYLRPLPKRKICLPCNTWGWCERTWHQASNVFIYWHDSVVDSS